MKTIVEQFKADLTDGLARYNAKDLPAGRLDGIIEQLLAMIRFIEATVDGTSELLAPLRAHAEDLMNLQHGHQPQGLLPGAHQGHPPLTVQETTDAKIAFSPPPSSRFANSTAGSPRISHICSTLRGPRRRPGPCSAPPSGLVSAPCSRKRSRARSGRGIRGAGRRSRFSSATGASDERRRGARLPGEPPSC